MYLNGTKCIALSLGCILSLSGMAKDKVPTVGQGAAKPLCFIENNGQLTDSKGKPLTDIQYTLSTAGMNLYIGNGGLHYQFRKPGAMKSAHPTLNTYNMDVTLLHANKAARVTEEEAQPYYETYYTANANGIQANSFRRVVYHDVYPGIDWVLYVKGNSVEYDFVVHPGADASQIQLKYDGATALSLAKDGSIKAVTPMGTVNEKKPFAYGSDGKEVASSFKLKGNVLSFATAPHKGTLTIDPIIFWSTYFGGTDEDVATAVVVSPAGNVYIGGYTTTTAGISLGTPPTVYDVTFNGLVDAFITKYDPNGVRQFTTYFGGAGDDRGTCMAIDNSGAGIFMGGHTTGSTGLATGGAYRTLNNGMTDGFIIKINNNGTRQWSTYYGGTGNDQIYGIVNDGAANNLYVTGRTESASLIASAGVYQTALSGAADAFVARFNGNSGVLGFSTYYGGTGADEGRAITVEGSGGNVIITGQTTSVVGIASTGADQITLNGTNDAFIAKLNTAGNARIWGTYYGGSGAEQGRGIICRTATGDIAITGYTNSTSGLATTGAQQPSYGGGLQDAFVAQYDASGAKQWSTYCGGSDVDYGEAVTVDPYGNVVVAGGTFSNNNIGSEGSMQPTIGGNYDAFLAKYTGGQGQRIWGTYFGDALYDYAYGAVCDASGQIIYAGHTTSTTGIATAGAAQTGYGGGVYDGFVTKLRIDTFALINQPYTDTLVCAGGTLTLSYNVNINFRAGNQFTAQLSNAAGSFAAPVNIGTSVSGTSGTITCTIPAGTPVGTGYRIRITGSNPAYISPDNFVNIRVVAGLPPVTINANNPVCVGNTLALSATATWSITSYNWAGPTAFSSGAPNPTRPSMTLADAGVYTLTTTHNGCPANVSTINIVVNNTTPPSPVAFASALNCNGGTLYLYADTSSSAITGSYSWTGPAGFTSTMQHPTLSPLTAANAGDYYVVDTIDGCPSLATTVNVTVTPNTPTGITISVSPNDTICEGTTVNFSSIGINAGVSPTYQWMVNGFPVVGAIASSWSSSTLTDGNVVTCVMTSSATCPAPANATSNPIGMNVIGSEMTVYIFAWPGLSVNPGDSIVFTSTVYDAGPGATYQWVRNGNDIPGATNATYTLHNVTVFDTITLAVTSIMPCVSPAIVQSNALVAHPNTGVNDIAAALSSMELFPNPNQGTFTLRGSMSSVTANEVTATLINTVGQVINRYELPVSNGVLQQQINAGNLTPGIYMLQVTTDGVSRTMRFTVQ